MKAIHLTACGNADLYDLLYAILGPGLPKGQEESFFEKFTRGSRESATPGVGLGLAISHAIMDAHRGRIWAQDNPGGGARFCFTLPPGTPPAMPPPEQAVSGSAHHRES
jgi:two-component system sensor histidine kinase KdpD